MLKTDMGPLDYGQLSTEKRHPGAGHLDRMSALQILRFMNREDRRLASAVGRCLKPISWAVRLIVQSLEDGGRLLFVGAGTSGRLGVLEAAECPPTFSTGPGVVQAIMAGGRKAVFHSIEGAEDSRQDAVSSIQRSGVSTKDVVVGIAASGVTPFVHSALAAARKRRARTILVTCNPRTSKRLADSVISVDTGPEVLSGSTRLKAGTVCKMVLNMLTTASMVRLGKVYGNRMVDLQPKSQKLVARAIRLIGEVCGVSPLQAKELLKRANGRVKVAILMEKRNLSPRKASQQLKAVKGVLRRAL